jgi:flavin-dependent dehydrogenase
VTEPVLDADVIVIGGGPAGAAMGSMLARDGRRVIVLEKDIHPRDHVGESLTPSTNLVLDRIGFIDKMDDAGFIHKPGTGWNSPRGALWRFIEVWLFEFPLPGTPRPYTYNVERDVMDAMLLRHAKDSGAQVLQGVKVSNVLFEQGRAVGVRATAGDGWERDLRSRFVIDATGRRCLLASQLGLKKKDPNFNQFCIYSWFRGVKRPPEKFDGFTLFYFLGLHKGWSWHIPLRNDVCSMGVVVDKADFQKSGKSHEDFFYGMVRRNRNFTFAMQDAERTRPWWIEGDYSYKVDRFAGPGWMLIGDALRFVDPIFSSGVDVALFSAQYAAETMAAVWRGEDESALMRAYQDRLESGVDIWYEMIDTFYRLQNLVSRFATRPGWRELIVRTLQGNPYQPETRERARKLLAAMHESYDKVMADPNNLMRPWTFDPQRSGSIDFTDVAEELLPPCPVCGGAVRFGDARATVVCQGCGLVSPTGPDREPLAVPERTPRR